MRRTADMSKPQAFCAAAQRASEAKKGAVEDGEASVIFVILFANAINGQLSAAGADAILDGGTAGTARCTST
jgi:hypothetical protein